MKPLAHSSKTNEGRFTPEQSYEDHIHGVYNKIQSILDGIKPYLKLDKFKEISCVALNAGNFHDMGKLCENCQTVLRQEMVGVKMPNHVDAGTKHLLDQGKPYAARLVLAHHLGWRLINEKETYPHEYHKFRDNSLVKMRCGWINTNDKMSAYVNKRLKNIVDLHNEINLPIIQEPEFKEKDISPWMRLALSVLVSADHFDTGKNYGDPIDIQTPTLRPQDRLDKLVNFIGQKTQTTLRNKVRQEVFQACMDSEIDNQYVICPSEVGTGKTTATLAYALKICQKHNLRRIFYVAPFTNIISQTVDTFRNLTLEGEDPLQVVAEHHHQVDYNNENWSAKYLANKWNCPIVATTAVQFFETLASCRTSRLSKLHELAGSFIILDESHDSIPVKLWPIATIWLRFLTEELGCRVLLASGTITKPWELPSFVKRIDPSWKNNIPSIIPKELAQKTRLDENKRIDIKYNKKSFKLLQFGRWLSSFKGPKVVVCNTVQNAAVVASSLRKQHTVIHLSTAQTPADREIILKEIKERLDNDPDKLEDWTLVATSCIEAGVDISFRYGFRENAGLSRALQLAGRVNRENLFDDASLWVFEFDQNDNNFTTNDDFTFAIAVFQAMYKEGKISPADCAESLEREMNLNGGVLIDKVDKILEYERDQEMGKQALECRVISEDKVTVLIKKDLVNPRITNTDIVRNSVEMYLGKTDHFTRQGLIKDSDEPLIKALENVKVWEGKYNQFLGYMAEPKARIY